MTTNLASINQTERSKSYLRMFDIAWQNLQIWNEEQRSRRVIRHKTNRTRSLAPKN